MLVDSVVSDICEVVDPPAGVEAGAVLNRLLREQDYRFQLPASKPFTLIYDQDEPLQPTSVTATLKFELLKDELIDIPSYYVLGGDLTDSFLATQKNPQQYRFIRFFQLLGWLIATDDSVQYYQYNEMKFLGVTVSLNPVRLSSEQNHFFASVLDQHSRCPTSEIVIPERSVIPYFSEELKLHGYVFLTLKYALSKRFSQSSSEDVMYEVHGDELYTSAKTRLKEGLGTLKLLSPNSLQFNRQRRAIKLTRLSAKGTWYAPDETHLGRRVGLGSKLNNPIVYSRFLKGGDIVTLFDRIIADFSVDELLMFMYNMVSQVVRMHSLGVVHRDLKPDNIMFDINKKTVEIIDFEHARDREASDPGYNSGTPDYAPFEVRQGLGTSEKSDVYSLAVILDFFYTERLTNQLSSDHNDMLASVLSESLSDSMKMRPEMPDLLNCFITILVQRQPFSLNEIDMQGMAAAEILAMKCFKNIETISPRIFSVSGWEKGLNDVVKLINETLDMLGDHPAEIVYFTRILNIPCLFDLRGKPTIREKLKSLQDHYAVFKDFILKVFTKSYLDGTYKWMTLESVENLIQHVQSRLDKRPAPQMSLFHVPVVSAPEKACMSLNGYRA